MKKVFVSMMMATALLVGGSAFAQTQTDGATGATAQKENTQKAKKCDKGCHEKKECNVSKACKEAKGQIAEKRARQMFDPFDGIQLTDDQQQKLQALQKGLGPVQLSKEQMAKIPENKNLSDAEKKQLKEERKNRELEAKKNYLQGVKETLTPDQYVIFLENCYIAAPQGTSHVKGMKQDRKGAHMHKDGKGKEHKGKRSTK